MATVSNEALRVDTEGRSRPGLWVSEMWAALAISVIWLTVLLDAIFGPDIVTRSAGGDSATVPSAVIVVFFAFFATWVVARYGFPRGRKSDRVV